MAKYSIRHSCGHYQEVELFGPDSERHRRIAWLEAHGICTACYLKAKSQEPPRFYARRTAKGIEFVCWSGSYAIKDTLKARGYRFGDVYPPDTGPAALMQVLRGPRKGWALHIEAQGETLREKGLAEGNWIKQQGWQLDVLPIGVSMLSAAVEGREDLVPPKVEKTT